jgi:hypothetical protein
MTTAVPPAENSRSVRSFVHREDADRAVVALDDAGIKSTVREYRVPDPVTGKPVTRAITVFVAAADTAAAARLMMKLPPSDAPSAAPRTDAPSRLRYRGRRGGPQKSSVFMIGFAVLCAAGMVLFATNGLSRKKKGPPPNTGNILLAEDLNYDQIDDVEREFTWDHKPVHHTEDRNFDTMWDIRWIYQKGVTAYRDVDLNFDGTWDERTTYAPTGHPFYTDLRPGGSGPVLVRRIFREGNPWKELEDRDADNHFDHLKEFNQFSEVIREEELPNGHAENNPPQPPPPWPEEE